MYSGIKLLKERLIEKGELVYMRINGIVHADEFVKFIRSYEGKGDIYIAGGGEYGKLIGKYLDKNDVRWTGYVDGYLEVPEMEEPETGRMIYSYPDSFAERDYFIISSRFYEDEIEEQLKGADVREENIFLFDRIEDIIFEFSGPAEEWEASFERIRRFHNMYQGQRCFVIGNGPSLSIKDLEKLENEVTFACNSIYAVYESTRWRPTYYCAWDGAFCEKNMGNKEDIAYLLSNCSAAFTSASAAKVPFRDDADLGKLFFVKWRREIDRETGLSLFSSDCSRCCYYSGTVSYLMLQLAAYMGFREIYLLGIDMSFTFERDEDGNVDDSNSYMTEMRQERSKQKYLAGYDINANKTEIEQKGCYMSARQYADTHGIKIYNATRGGKLKLFERVELDKILD